MNLASKQNIIVAIVTVIFLLSSASAFGFRCGRKIVTENMHEAQVLRACGEPASARRIGYALRGTYVPYRRTVAPGMNLERFPGYGHYVEEVELVEYIYNFGPRKLMRRLMFEGGVLVRIDTIGYGYREKDTN